MNELFAEDLLRQELLADLGNGDVTTQLALSGANPLLDAQLVQREAGVFCGELIPRLSFRMLDANAQVSLLCEEGAELPPGSVLARIRCEARAMLAAERTTLNFLQRMCGIATEARRWATLAAPLGIRIVETRKTTPGFRMFEKHAVFIGSGYNHRIGLDSAVMLKDNHFAASPHDSWEELVRSVKSRIGHTLKLEAEADSLAMLEPLLRGGADIIMLDNFSPDEVREAIRIIAGRCTVEVSGGINSGNLQDYLIPGVDVISSGALSHSTHSLDIALEVSGEAR